MNKPELNPRWIHLLLTIKHACMEDNDLSMKATGCGKLAAARYIDALIACAVKLETACEDYFEAMERNENECQEYYELLGGYEPDMLTDAQIAEVKALVMKWKGDDDEEGNHEA